MTRGGPGVLGNPSQFSLWYYANTDNRKALSFYYNGGPLADTKNSSRHDIIPRSTGAPPRRCRLNAACATSSTTTIRSG